MDYSNVFGYKRQSNTRIWNHYYEGIDIIDCEDQCNLNKSCIAFMMMPRGNWRPRCFLFKNTDFIKPEFGWTTFLKEEASVVPLEDTSTKVGNTEWSPKDVCVHNGKMLIFLI